ncbi:chaplin [Streptantibioticus rubrisoli]|uniref:chaplin n=1 Tax=Streptantibioticus rubrisoli TaxID=1387313 RepID=UPI00360EA60D
MVARDPRRRGRCGPHVRPTPPNGCNSPYGAFPTRRKAATRIPFANQSFDTPEERGVNKLKNAVVVAVIAGGALAGGSGAAFADAGAAGAAVGSPGVISGNVIQVPISLPINLCGNSIDIIALLNPTFGNACASK